MATKVVRIDDLNPKVEATETVIYGIDGKNWEIDLSRDNAQKLRDALAPYEAVSREISSKEAARRTAQAINGPSGNGQLFGDTDPSTIRAWAQANGYDVNDKGRVPENIVSAYLKAQEAPTTKTASV